MSFCVKRTGRRYGKRKQKNKPVRFRTGLLFCALLVAHRGEALAAIHRAILPGLEGNLGLSTAVRAHGVVHHAGSTVVPRGLVLLTALTATSRLVLKALFRVEFLLTGGKHEFVTAVTAHQRLVLIHCF